MFFHLAMIVSAFVIALTSYQPVQARANNFTLKPVRVGDNLLSILRQHGFSEKERQEVLAQDQSLRHLYLTLDTRYLVRTAKGETEIVMFDSQTADAYRIFKRGSRVVANKYDPKFKTTTVRIEGRIYGSLMGSILPKLNSNFVASRFMDAYAFELRAQKSLQRGAHFWFTVEKKYLGPHFIKYGEVLQTSLDIGGERLQKRFVRHKGGGVFFNEQDLLDEKPFYAPVDYLKIASQFQPNRRHPITRRVQPHLGVDFELPTGEPVYAPRTGRVVRYGHNRAAGNYIVLLHSNGMETSYNHLRKIDRHIRVGLQIKAGEHIAEVGCTGYCTRPHLHFAVKKKGRMVDPLNYIKAYPVHFERMLESRVATN
ncbi:M23 family metallopeptidase [Bdellovibrio sp. HCB2-146]|uniref:M23 family metallopeptidase n=1 Tax=Bdellovibrio sp. HCB2-146 TaxID=3394362 RepID=UPI0039BCEFFD